MKLRLGLLVILVLTLTLAAFSTSGAAPFCNITSQTRHMVSGDVFYVSFNLGKATKLDWAAIAYPWGPRPSNWAVYTLTIDAQDLVDRTGSYDAWVTIALPEDHYRHGEFYVTGENGFWCKAELGTLQVEE